MFLFAVLFSTYTSVSSGEESKKTYHQILPLYKKSIFSFGVGVSSLKIPDRIYGIEALNTREHLQDKLEDTNKSYGYFMQNFPDAFRQINAVNFQFRLKF